MVLTRSQDGESKGKEEEVEDPMAARMSRLEELVKEQNQKFYRTLSEMIEASNRFKRVLDDPIAELKQLKEMNGIVEYHKKFELLSTRVNLREDDLVRVYLDGLQIDTRVNVQMFQPQTIQQCFSIGSLYEYAHPRSNIDNVGSLPLKRDSELKAEEDNEEDEIEVEMESIGLEDNLVHGALLEEESTPQVSIANSEILRSNELREANLRFENIDNVVMNENLEHEWIQKNIHKIFEVHSDVEKSHNVISNTKNCCAHQVFGKRSQAKDILTLKKRRKGLKSWMFKYKQENKRLWRLRNHVFSFPKLCDRRIDRPRTTRKVKLFGGIEIVYIKNFVSLVVVGEVHEAPEINKSF
ncbi:uncharacterized protein LOC110227212 [Arabidopsis lyrata subsp. lyrata]|uniref:uncharacterized protein LOC110227212 n=1 Tax=Arabidopsis lyrata subsp. lyrata TaxID=81972 RepID=UPI000A29BE4A|nr:uncharacterized protein LOC110227212 [Arabidopsis lyrata subsp. lyrata]|eukprot:XP_020876428.1 uncharacterized protein LOC110227212 [Arabidopsis lyrata subsp. lyrata]